MLEIAKCKPEICTLKRLPTQENSIAPIRTQRPTDRNPPKKEKSFLLIKAYPDKVKKTAAVVASACTITKPPEAESCKYRLRVGPSEKPRRPVKAKTQAKAELRWAFLCKRHKQKKPASRAMMPVIGGAATAIEMPAVTALKATVIANNI